MLVLYQSKDKILLMFNNVTPRYLKETKKKKFLVPKVTITEKLLSKILQITPLISSLISLLNDILFHFLTTIQRQSYTKDIKNVHLHHKTLVNPQKNISVQLLILLETLVDDHTLAWVRFLGIGSKGDFSSIDIRLLIKESYETHILYEVSW